jgi:hypothetical protein
VTLGAAGADAAIAGPLGSLALGAVRAASPLLTLRALRWYRDLARLGLHVPLVVVHDVGLLFAAPEEQRAFLTLAPGEGVAQRVARLPETLMAYRALVKELAQSDVCRRASALRLTDDLVVVLLARLLAPVVRRTNAKAPYPATIPLELALVDGVEARLQGLFLAMPRGFEAASLDALCKGRLQVLTLADALDLDTVRLLGLLGAGSATAGALAQVDLLSVLSTPAVSDVAHFSLELLPSVLESHGPRTAGTYASEGYSGVGTHGSLDSLVLTELAWDEDEFLRRLVEGELLHYTREQAAAPSRRLHYIVIDASASMRGDRQVFARGLAVALTKKLHLMGEDTWLRFFDARLYDVHRPRVGHVPAGWLLSFRGERGRNPARVFTQLATELALVRRRDRREIIVHLVTHAALHVPRSLVAEVRSSARIFGVFILPGGGTLDLSYLDLLDGHAVVDHATLGERPARAAAATRIVQDATR